MFLGLENFLFCSVIDYFRTVELDLVQIRICKTCVLSYMQGVSKGLVAKRLLSIMQEKGPSPDFVLCIGDDRSDEDMFEVITSSMAGPSIAPRAEVFACTVGKKPSKAKYYLDDTVEIVRLMQGLASVSEQTNSG